MIKKIIDYLFPIMTLDERVNRWCSSIGKHTSYGKDITQEYLDKIGFPKRRFFLTNK
jgi:hypothetical protein